MFHTNHHSTPPVRGAGGNFEILNEKPHYFIPDVDSTGKTVFITIKISIPHPRGYN